MIGRPDDVDCSISSRRSCYVPATISTTTTRLPAWLLPRRRHTTTAWPSWSASGASTRRLPSTTSQSTAGRRGRRAQGGPTSCRRCRGIGTPPAGTGLHEVHINRQRWTRAGDASSASGAVYATGVPHSSVARTAIVCGACVNLIHIAHTLHAAAAGGCDTPSSLEALMNCVELCMQMRFFLLVPTGQSPPPIHLAATVICTSRGSHLCR